MLTQIILKEHVTYSPETGEFKRVRRKSTRKRFGTLFWSGYIRAVILGQAYFAHRLAWLYVYGEWPKGEIDHINGDKTDNRICNLRDTTVSVNQQNQKKAHSDNSTGYLGVTKMGNRWRAMITVSGNVIRLGMFDSPETAHQVYLEAKRKLHSGCTI